MTDPMLHTLIALCGMWFTFLWGRYSELGKLSEEIVARTIDSLAENGYIAVTKDRDGNVELIKIEDLDSTKKDFV